MYCNRNIVRTRALTYSSVKYGARAPMTRINTKYAFVPRRKRVAAVRRRDKMLITAVENDTVPGPNPFRVSGRRILVFETFR